MVLTLQDRRTGSPAWRWSHTDRDYPRGWVVSPGLRDSHYRLSIIYASVEDSGEYRCETPLGLVNSVRVVVTSLECPPLTRTDHPARLNSSETHVGAVVEVSCPTGSLVSGETVLHCRDDGSWSDARPAECVPVQCPPLEISSPHLQLLSLNNSYLGTARFSCPLGYTLQPPLTDIWCGQAGLWSAPVPSCHLIHCSVPPQPEHATMVISGSTVGHTVTTTCLEGYLLIGQSVTR